MISALLCAGVLFVGCRAEADKPSGETASRDDSAPGDSTPTDSSDTAEPDTTDSVRHTGDSGGTEVLKNLDEGGAHLAILGEAENARLSIVGLVDVNVDGRVDLIVDWYGPGTQAMGVFIGPVDNGEYRASDMQLRIGGTGWAGSLLPILDGADTQGFVTNQYSVDERFQETLYVPAPIDADVSLDVISARWTDCLPAATSPDATGDALADLLLVDSGSSWSGVSGGAAWLVEAPFDHGGSTEDARTVFYDTVEGSDLGASGTFADFDGDGVDEVALGAPEYTRSLYIGAAPGRVVVGPDSPAGSISAEDMITISGEVDVGGFGQEINAGDLDGDGYDDLIVGNFEEVVYVFSGPILASGSATEASSTVSEPGRPVTLFGLSLAPVQDLDQDGAMDLLIGASYYPAYPSTDGAAWLAWGPIRGAVELEDGVNASSFHTAQPDDRAGSRVSLGDYDNDGFPDVGVRAPDFDTEFTDAGAAFFVSGATLR